MKDFTVNEDNGIKQTTLLYKGKAVGYIGWPKVPIRDRKFLIDKWLSLNSKAVEAAWEQEKYQRDLPNKPWWARVLFIIKGV